MRSVVSQLKPARYLQLIEFQAQMFAIRFSFGRVIHGQVWNKLWAATAPAQNAANKIAPIAATSIAIEPVASRGVCPDPPTIGGASRQPTSSANGSPSAKARQKTGGTPGSGIAATAYAPRHSQEAVTSVVGHHRPTIPTSSTISTLAHGTALAGEGIPEPIRKPILARAMPRGFSG